MALWIVTIGNSDIQLNSEDDWDTLRAKIGNNSIMGDDFQSPGNKNEWDRFAPPARVLGMLYHQVMEDCPSLEFPILDVLCSRFAPPDTQRPDRIAVLLTDQQNIVCESTLHTGHPFWQDTCTLQPLLAWYFKDRQKLTDNLQFLVIKPTNPQGKSGVDNWNEMIGAVGQQLAEISVDIGETVYVSHQAGTPAISAAVQFLTVSRFGDVTFLNSEGYYENGNPQYRPVLIPSSQYWRGLQIQKAKTLIRDGFPGAALKLIEDLDAAEEAKIELEKLAEKFNIKATGESIVEFTWENTSKRIRNSLDLIEIFFEQGNYIQGITLVAAAHETFLKAAIVRQLERLTATVSGIKPVDFVKWDNQGLHFAHQNEIKATPGYDGSGDDVDLSAVLHFPLPQKNDGNQQDPDYDKFWKTYLSKDMCGFKISSMKSPNTSPKNERGSMKSPNTSTKNERERRLFTINNSRLFKWLRALSPAWESWGLLDWIGTHKREYEGDRRNQLMHNLRGVDQSSAIRYLLGQGSKSDIPGEYTDKSVAGVYQECVKNKFIKAMHHLSLLKSDSTENNLQQELDRLAESLE